MVEAGVGLVTAENGQGSTFRRGYEITGNSALILNNPMLGAQ
jgi:hypothetical protein